MCNVSKMPRWETTAIAEHALRPGEMQAVAVSGLDIVVARTGNGALAAFDQWCSHEECPLADGDLEGDRVLCYCHSSEFDIWTGAALRGPATEPIAVYEAKALDGEVHVAIPDTA